MKENVEKGKNRGGKKESIENKKVESKKDKIIFKDFARAYEITHNLSLVRKWQIIIFKNLYGKPLGYKWPPNVELPKRGFAIQLKFYGLNDIQSQHDVPLITIEISRITHKYVERVHSELTNFFQKLDHKITYLETPF